jgi:SAM-dependent methyltransferase
VEGPGAPLGGVTAVPYLTPYYDPALYDLVYAKVRDDIPFYLELAKAARGAVLEVACGTGRVLIPILEAGVEIHGLDLDGGMLERLRGQAAERGLQPRVFQGDMRDFTMPTRYALVTIPFRAFMHLESTADQIRALRCIREHLEPDGRLAFNLFYPSFDFIRDNEGRRVLSIEVDEPGSGKPVRVFDISRYDRVGQTVTVEREVVIGEGPDTITRQVGFRLRWTYRYEMELLLRAAGFAGAEFFGGFDRRPLERDTDEMGVLARRD